MIDLDELDELISDSQSYGYAYTDYVTDILPKIVHMAAELRAARELITHSRRLRVCCLGDASRENIMIRGFDDANEKYAEVLDWTGLDE